MATNKLIALVGAGGKMGTRVSVNLKKYGYDFIGCESDEEKKKALEARGIKAMETGEAVGMAEIVIFALPDALIPKLSALFVPKMKPGSIGIILDPAAAYAKELTMRDDCTFVVTHPCHPALFGDFKTKEEQDDMFGGIAAEQDIVIALAQGDEKLFTEAESVCRDMFSPVGTCHRITVEQMAMLEPAAAEVVIAAMATVMKEALDEVVARGVPEAAARAFLLGHTRIPLAIVFKQSNPFSDAALKAIEFGRKRILRDDWKSVFEKDAINEALHYMLGL
ncbi:MAG: semialdehyde dehydrogenase [Oscillospiraceae bacterium]|nr:semialdehyde dehydrogenase [Oscillospiraceae bacterium]